MTMNMLYSKKIILFYLIIVLTISIIGSLLEFVVIFDKSFGMIGITGNIFYLYVLMLEVVIFSSGFVLFIRNSNKFISYLIVGAAIAVIISILNILIILTHLLLMMYPIYSSEYSFNLLIKEFSLILIIGLLSFPFILVFKKIKLTDF